MRLALVVALCLAALLVAAPALSRPANPRPVNITAPAGKPFTGVVAVYTNLGKEDTVDDDTATIAWGDGTGSAGTLRQVAPGDDKDVEVSGTHTYSKPGVYRVRVTMDDPNPNPAVESSGTAVVTGPPVIGAPANVPLRGAARLTVAGPAPGTSFSWDLDGDGTFERSTGTTPFVDHVFPVAGDRGVGVRTSSGATAARKLHVNGRPRFFLALPKRGVRKGRSARIRAFARSDRTAPVAYYEWRFAGKGKSKGKKQLGPYAAPAGSVLTKSPGIVHQFTKKKTAFTATAHAKDGQQSTIGGFVKAGKDGYITAFEVLGTAAAGLPGADFRDISTEPTNKIFSINTVCDPNDLGADGQCFKFKTDLSPHKVGGWAFGGAGKCFVGCEGGFEAFYRYDKPGNYKVTMTVKRTVPKVTEKVSMNVPVVPSYCKPLKVRGVTVDPKGCFTVIDPPGPTSQAYVATGGITVGGLDVKPLESAAAIQVVPSKFTVAVAPGGGQLEVSHGGRPLSRSVGFTIPKGGVMPVEFSALIAKSRPKVNGLVAGGAEVAFTGGNARLTYHLELPPPFRATSPFTVNAGATASAAQADGFTVGPVSLDIAPGFALNDVTFKYVPPKFQGDNSDGVGYFGGGKLDVFGTKIDAQNNFPENPATGFGLTSGGAFKYGGATYGFTPGIALGSTGAFLQSITASINADPFTFTGGARITAASVFALDGCVAVVVAGEADVGKKAPFCKDEHGNSDSYVAQSPGLAIRVHGQGSVVGIPLPGNAYGQWTPPNNIRVRGHVGYKLPLVVGTVTLSGDVFADFQSVSSWQAGMSTSITQDIVCVPFTDICPSLTAGGIISSKGVAGCGPLPIVFIPFAAWVTTDGDVGALPFGCDTAFGKVKIARAPTRLVAARAAGPFGTSARSLRLRSGPPFALVRLTGANGPPSVTAKGPGLSAQSGTAQPRFRRSRPLVFRSDALRSTFVYIPRPRRGGYTFTEQAGSTPIVKSEVSYGQGLPKIKARVRKGRLRYSIADLGANRVTFYEQAKGFQAPIGRARGRRGSIRLTPNPGPNGRRRVVALIEANGLPRARRTVASFRARPTHLRAPRVRAAGRGSRLRVRWTAVRGARRYQVTVTTAGRKVRRTVRTRSFTVAGFRRDQTARVVVRAVGADLRLGRPGRARAARRAKGTTRLPLG